MPPGIIAKGKTNVLLIQHQAEMTEINESVPNNVMFD
jgi:hypothetical protein